MRPEVRRRSVRGQASTLCRQAHACQRVLLSVVRPGHSAPPLGRERLPLSVVGGPIDGADDTLDLGTDGSLSECYFAISEHIHDIAGSIAAVIPRLHSGIHRSEGDASGPRARPPRQTQRQTERASNLRARLTLAWSGPTPIAATNHPRGLPAGRLIVG
jgi:hypothetical protein